MRAVMREVIPLERSAGAAEWPVYGHRWAVQHLQRTIESEPAEGGGPRHAYLFLGPRQIGKSTFARAFAQALLCTGEKRPCGECRSCRLMVRGTHPDLHVVAPLVKAGGSDEELDDKAVVDRVAGKLYFPQARQIVHFANIRPQEGRYKIFLIQEAHQIWNVRFFNLLLKTLEEPPAYVILLLTASDRDAILPTVVSRCQVLELHPLDPTTVSAALQGGWSVPAERAELLARLCNGRLGWAVEQARSEQSWQERESRLEQLWQLMAADRAERLAISEKMAGRSAQLFATLELWSTWWRDLLLVQSGCAEACSNLDQRARLERQAQTLRPGEVQEYINTLKRVEAHLRHTVNPRLALDVLFLRLPQFSA